MTLSKKHFEKLAEVLGNLQSWSDKNNDNIKIKIVINDLINNFCIPFNNNFDIETFKKAIQKSYCDKSDKFKFHINKH
jgi:hypothetical protein